MTKAARSRRLMAWGSRRRWRRTPHAGWAARSRASRSRHGRGTARASRGSMPPGGRVELPEIVAQHRVGWERGAPGAVARAGAEADARRKCPRASAIVPSKRTLPPAMIAIRSHRRSAWAMTWVEKRIVAPSAPVRGSAPPAAAGDRVEAGEGLVQHDKARRGRWCRGAGRAAPCPWDRPRIGRSAGRPCSASSASARRRPSAASGRPRSAPRKAIDSRAFMPDKGRAPREGSRLAGQRRVDRFWPRQAPLTGIGIDDAEQHPQRSSSCRRRWGPEHAVDRAPVRRRDRCRRQRGRRRSFSRGRARGCRFPPWKAASSKSAAGRYPSSSLPSRG